jgi:hypothetical protein
LFCTSEIAEVIARETNRYAQNFLENTHKLKPRYGAHRWKETNGNEIIKLLVFFFFSVTRTSPETGQKKLFFLEKNSGNTHIFGPVQ